MQWPTSKRTIWLFGQRAAQNTRCTKAEARRTVAGQTGTAEPTEAQRLAAWEAQTARREAQFLSAVHQEVARFDWRGRNRYELGCSSAQVHMPWPFRQSCPVTT